MAAVSEHPGREFDQFPVVADDCVRAQLDVLGVPLNVLLDVGQLQLGHFLAQALLRNHPIQDDEVFKQVDPTFV